MRRQRVLRTGRGPRSALAACRGAGPSERTSGPVRRPSTGAICGALDSGFLKKARSLEPCGVSVSREQSLGHGLSGGRAGRGGRMSQRRSGPSRRRQRAGSAMLMILAFLRKPDLQHDAAAACPGNGARATAHPGRPVAPRSLVMGVGTGMGEGRWRAAAHDRGRLVHERPVGHRRDHQAREVGLPGAVADEDRVADVPAPDGPARAGRAPTAAPMSTTERTAGNRRDRGGGAHLLDGGRWCGNRRCSRRLWGTAPLGSSLHPRSRAERWGSPAEPGANGRCASGAGRVRLMLSGRAGIGDAVAGLVGGLLRP